MIAALPQTAPAQTLKAVMHSDIKILDPIWVSSVITRAYSYMIYDTLFAMDEHGEIKPQMVDKYDVSADKLIYTFTLRDGLVWHDGLPVKAEDCIASIKRWAARDPLGQRIAASTVAMTANDEKTFTITLKSPISLLLFGLAKPAGLVPFMMPKRVADTDAYKQITDPTGSGPFVFKKDEWKPGDKVVFAKFDKYKPRSEAASGYAGGKVVKVNRVEWIAVADPQQAVNALLQNEVDYLEGPPQDLLPLLKDSKGVKIFRVNMLGGQYSFRPNHLQKPFNDLKIRQAAAYAFNQQDFLDAAIGDPDNYKVCKSYFICGTPLASEKGMEGLLESNFEKARSLLKEANYDGTPVVLLHSTDVPQLANLAPVAKSLLEKAGFKVDMQSTDWQTVLGRLQKRDAVSAGGWSGYLTLFGSLDLLNPVINGFMAANCEKAMQGWPCDAEIEKLRDDFANEPDPAKQRAIAEAFQIREREVVTHIPLGQIHTVSAARTTIGGTFKAAGTVFWNLEKK